MKCQVYELEEEKSISPRAFAHLVSATLYEKRYALHCIYLFCFIEIFSALDHILLNQLSLVSKEMEIPLLSVQWI